ncbi:hypothetical protein L6452_46467 [Arctium lappa]|nr:hypothetical protein L6452_46467 [Arctium lappa]
MTPTCRLATTLRPCDPREADGGRRCVPVGCGTARAGPPIDSGRGPVRIGAAAKARAVDMPVEMPSRRSWLAASAVTACLGTCVLPAPACGHPIRPVLKHGPRSLTCPAHPGNDSVGGRVQRLEEQPHVARCPGAPRRPLKIRRTECLPHAPVVLITASGLQGEQPLVDGTM